MYKSFTNIFLSLALNVLLCNVTHSQNVSISEIMYDTPLNERIATGSAYSNGEYIELYNSGTTVADLTGWRLEGGGTTEIFYLPSGTQIAANGSIVIAYQYNNSNFQLSDLYDFLMPAGSEIIYQRKIILSNSGESIVLKDNHSIVRDSIFYDGTSNKTKPNRLSAENADGITGSECKSIQRVCVKWNNNGNCITDNSNWETGLVTPGIVKLSVLNVAESTQNYIVDRTVLSEDGNRYIDKIQYYDGLGRPYETVQKGITPSKANLVSLSEYDTFGRESNQWLPIVCGSNFVSPSDFISQASNNYGGDSRPYSYPVYEPSPLSRVVAQYGPGEAWNNHPVRTDYLTNTASGDLCCKCYDVNNSGALVCNGDYSAGQLYVTKNTDEDGRVAYTFTDKLERTILLRQFNDGEHIDTYYVYDETGNQRYVLPPLASDGLQNNGTYTLSANNVLGLYGYYYRYDNRNRCIEKKLPGVEPFYYVYDKIDRLRLSQDGIQRDRNEWTFYKYDVLGREILRGIYKKGNSGEGFSHIDMMNRLETNTTFFEKFTVDGMDMYTCQCYPSVMDRMTTLIANYYDDYKYIDEGYSRLPSTFKDNVAFAGGVSDAEYVSAKGLLTGTKALVLDGGNKYLWSCVRYDYKGQPVQTIKMNILDGIYKEFIKYTFTGQIKEKVTINTNPEARDTRYLELREDYRYEYDHADRLTETWHTINGRGPDLLAINEYDELGRLSTLKLGKDFPITQNNGYVQTTNYQYNIRNWLTSIDSEEFKQKLYYQDSMPSEEPNIQCYNGNISAMTTWIGYAYSSASVGSYHYNYDNLNRLTNARYGSNNGTFSGLKYKFDERLSYDKQGNILQHTNDGVIDYRISGVTQNIEMEYSGNQLIKATNQGEQVLTYGSLFFKDDANESVEYFYDKNGNLIQDRNKKITAIKYNLLNLPEKVQFSNGNSLKFVYDATGTKHSMQSLTLKTNVYVQMGNLYEPSTEEINSSNWDHYCGNMVYGQGPKTPYFVRSLNSYGYNYLDAGNTMYCFLLKNHLGSVCVDRFEYVVENWTHYYPFGLKFDPNGSPSVHSFGDGEFCGKERIWYHGFNLYDFGLRMYAMDLGRWMSMDPLCEKYYSISPYAYCMNNPVNNVDLRGDSITTTIKCTVTNSDGTSSIQSDRYYYGQDVSGNYGFIGPDGSLYSGDNKFVNGLSKALGTLRRASRGNSLVGGLMNSTNNVEIVQGKNGADPKGNFIYWNPNMTEGGPDLNGGVNRPAYIGLGHEMAHIEDVWNGTYNASTWLTVGEYSVPNAEKYAIHVENQLRSEHKLVLRNAYLRMPSDMNNPTIILRNGTNQSIFYRKIEVIRGSIVPTIPFVY